MSRATSVQARAALYAAQTAKVIVQLITIDHEDMVAPVRLVSDHQDLVSRGDTYTAFPFVPMMPAAVPDEEPRLDLVCYDVTRDLIAAVRSIATPATITLEIVLADSPDTVEAGPWQFDVSQAQYSASELRLSLTAERLLTEPYPHRLFTPTDFPGLFRGVRR